MQKSGETAEFVYNENGLRVQKTATSTGVTKYTLHGKNIVHMTQGSNELHFFYDAQNKPAVVVYNGTPYSYVKNLQGDIVAILDSNKNVVVSYVYDAWGRPISCSGTMASTLGKINPFRYRGYVYDEETGLYYLQSRYYGPELVRFLNADIYVSTGQGLLDSNMFAYCWNNPVVRSDAAGTNPLEQLFDDGDTRPGDDLKVNHGRCPGGGGGNTWGAFIRTLQSAANGLTMPLGRANMAITEKHHILTNKNKTYTPKITEITDKYGMSLNGKENIVLLPGHKGRHTNAYHEVMLLGLEQLDAYANGNIAIFMEGMGEMGKFLLEYYWIPYGK